MPNVIARAHLGLSDRGHRGDGLIRRLRGRCLVVPIVFGDNVINGEGHASSGRFERGGQRLAQRSFVEGCGTAKRISRIVVMLSAFGDRIVGNRLRNTPRLRRDSIVSNRLRLKTVRIRRRKLRQSGARTQRLFQNPCQLFERVVQLVVERLTARAGGTGQVPHRHTTPRLSPHGDLSLHKIDH
ncbi:hypothetical protein LQ948_08245 [Jiella sp. MQZ9-1]|uniref:Uncharacterized protein n=1 Tax=Jiella flava TaxID=2816857 RepID=A0A939G082_9HYPH|nr:hypothetical protein [Jiella flava]MBO0662777.1 hypothetical protein [Jiella flava]MCD2471198.1 hypothetical protein [Jiella flava]